MPGPEKMTAFEGNKVFGQLYFAQLKYELLHLLQALSTEVKMPRAH